MVEDEGGGLLQVTDPQAALGAEHFGADIVTVDGIAAEIDVADGVVGEAQVHDGIIDITHVFQFGVSQGAAQAVTGEPHGPLWSRLDEALEKEPASRRPFPYLLQGFVEPLVHAAAFRERKGRDIFVNVDFYSASLYYAMGIPMDMFTPVFAISRMAGWAAHVIEEQFAGAAPKPVLYRPESEYIGEYCGPAECAFVPLNER